MNIKSRHLPWFALLPLTCGLGLPCSGQVSHPIPWNVVGAYTCVAPLTDEPPQSLYLLPDMQWDLASPFTPKAVHTEKIDVRSRAWRGKLAYALLPPGLFSFESGVVRLYNTETLEVGRDGNIHIGRLRSLTEGLSRPSALSPPPPTEFLAQMLIVAFQFDERSQQLIEVLPSDSTRLPVRCQRGPLFLPSQL
ncbi:MAG TPA: hypothetical protein VIB39_20210 [Candidatus Angelobacter sp.]|jgi:hypothetical protein